MRTPPLSLQSSHAAVQQRISDPDERRWVEPRLAHLIGLEDRVARDKEDLFAAWRLFFERMAEVEPVVMSFEDMQWADASLLDFIEYLLDWSRNHSIFVLTLARPELVDDGRAGGQADATSPRSISSRSVKRPCVTSSPGSCPDCRTR